MGWGEAMNVLLHLMVHVVNILECRVNLNLTHMLLCLRMLLPYRNIGLIWFDVVLMEYVSTLAHVVSILEVGLMVR